MFRHARLLNHSCVIQVRKSLSHMFSSLRDAFKAHRLQAREQRLRRDSLRELSVMSDHMLRDIGLRREDIRPLLDRESGARQNEEPSKEMIDCRCCARRSCCA